MKKKSYLSLYFLSLVFMIVALLPACKKNADVGSSAPPVITSIKSYVASPNDTVLNRAEAKGQWVVITGQNLQNATQINFDGVPASFNNALFAPGSAVVQIPNIQFAKIDTAKLYTVDYKTTAGSTTFSFKLGPAAPAVWTISNIYANPGDSVFVNGANLFFVRSFSYRGTAIPSFKLDTNGTSIGFLMPAATTNDRVLVTTKIGTVNFKINATPVIAGISNENANPGDSVYIYGSYLKDIQTLTFAGTPVTSYKSSKDGSYVGFVLPTLTQSGPVSVTTDFGTGTTVYKVHDLVSGIIANIENDKWGMIGWDGGTQSTGNPANAQSWLPYNPDFPGNTSNFAVLKTNILEPGEGYGDGWPPDYQLAFDKEQWIPQANLGDSIQNYALKFEISIPKAWNGGALNIKVNGKTTFIYRWEPWKRSGTTATVAYTTKGWMTLTVPFTEFRKTDLDLGDGKGVAMTQFSDILDSSGNGTCFIWLHNYGAFNTATGFYGAVDNLRVIKIK
ncbi:glycan-binding surface protein [Mucilaginibacter sp. RCC_168]|uniref:glycan-binding surface protein n=1 Tax=Mucilaginibacter sp. RCC_168 TaxID=3239221 RepID=UPI0035254F4F